MHPRLTFTGLLFKSLDPAEIAHSARLAGADRVGLSSDMLEQVGAAAARTHFDGVGVEVTHIATRELVHYSNHPKSGSRFADPRDLVAAAQTLGARFIYGVTGSTVPLEWEAGATAFAAEIRPLANEATLHGLPVIIESTSGPMTSDVSFVHSFRDAVDLVEIADIGVCLDLNHCWTERGLRETIARAGRRLQHVQVSDMVLGRRDRFRAVPGDGIIPLQRILGWVLESGYSGLFDLEISPGPDMSATETLSRAIERAEGLLSELGL